MRRGGAADRVFLDTNVVVYAYSASEEARRGRARGLLDAPGATVSGQVLSELANVLQRKFGLKPSDVRPRVAEVAERCEVVPVSAAIVLDALRLCERYRLSFFDGQIAAAALAGGAGILYSEDLHDGLLIDGRLRVTSPFRPRAEQARARYRVRNRR